jgi:hypothetical protein
LTSDEVQNIEFQVPKQSLGGVQDSDQCILPVLMAFHRHFQQLETPVAAGVLGSGFRMTGFDERRHGVLPNMLSSVVAKN